MKDIDWDQVKSEIIEKVNILNYCNKHLKKVRKERNEEISACCPYHNDSTPSFFINSQTGLFKCHGCGQEGSFFDLHMFLHNMDFKEALLDLAENSGTNIESRRHDSINPPPKSQTKNKIDENFVKFWIKSLQSNKKLLDQIKRLRGLTDKTIARFEIGWDGKRYTIPIRDESGQLVNIRRYAPHVAKCKMINYTHGDQSYGSPARLYGIDALKRAPKERPVVVTEGEFDRLMLEQAGFLAVTGTAGCRTWRDEWSQLLTGRRVAIIFDSDEEGQKAAIEKVAPSIVKYSENLKVVKLPLHPQQGKDITDWFRIRKTIGELKEVIKLTSSYKDSKMKEPYNWNVKKLVKINTDPPTYIMHVDEGIIELTTRQLSKPSVFKEKFLEKFNKVIILPKKGDKPWDDYIEEIMNEKREDIETSIESSMPGSLTEFLIEHLLSMPIGEDIRALRRGHAISHGNTRAFKLRPLFKEVDIEFHSSFKLHEITSKLLKLGCKDNKFIKIDKKSERVWLMPAELIMRETGKLVD